MEIALIADDTKKELTAQFCIAYCGILSKHNLCATGVTGKYISDATGLKIEKLLSGPSGGADQIASRVAFDEIDMLLFFRDAAVTSHGGEHDFNLLRLCDLHNVPVATNIATAEILVRALDRGDFDWRDLVNPRSEYNRKKRAGKGY
ncbi:MAG: methylglyoxal synthase [Clostridia bacterium]|nr:methylglyoxal synthase [Clostridia bacterium]